MKLLEKRAPARRRPSRSEQAMHAFVCQQALRALIVQQAMRFLMPEKAMRAFTDPPPPTLNLQP